MKNSSKDLSKSGDYIFEETSEGIKFVGDFDGLYETTDDPWGQIQDECYRKRRLLLVNNIMELNPISILDIGCGLGHATQLLKILVTEHTHGVDISKVAIERAYKLFPDVDFSVFDITKKPYKFKHDVIILNNMLWYILDDIDKVFINIDKCLEESGYIVIPQAFIEDQKYGNDIINGYEGFIKYLSKYYDEYSLIKTEHIHTSYRKTDSITILQKRG